MEAAAYLLARTDVRGPDECWPWKLSCGSHGYGQGCLGGKVILAHRATYEAFVGAIPPGLTVDHRCHNRVCQNPSHLRVVPNLVNAEDQGQRQKTHCPMGHPYNERNTYFTARGHRQCRKCRNRWR